ncbi:DUF885 domain-containing protein [Phenylobacterium sp.]|jgi:uncharacterized protein (DUF885 family)|uniref:DUF885 domain-containing protein n=1 Tax=Phenylobacterium sp. TaxID=1871053 RepID=UPI0035B006FB
MHRLISRRSLIAAAGFAAMPLNAALAQGGSAEDAAFAKLGRDWLEGSLRLSPVFATATGDHRFDAELDDMSAVGRAATVKLNRDLLARLKTIPRDKLSRANQVDAAILENQLAGQVWTDQVLQDWAWDPLIYSNVAGGALNSLMSREFAPLADRLRSATARMEKLPALLAQSRRELQPKRVPKVHADTAVLQNKGLHSLVAQVTAEAGALSGADRTQLDAAAAALTKAIDEHQVWLEKTLAPNAAGDFRIGAELYDRKLAFALNSSLGRAEIKAKALAALGTIRAQMYDIARGVVAGRPGAPEAPVSPTPDQQQKVIEAALELVYARKPARNGLVEEAERQLKQTTEFVRAKGLVTVPQEPVKVILTPEFQRGVAVAYCDPPGPLDKGQSTFYKISPIPDDWTDAQADSFLREYNLFGMQEVTIHEAMPGHYLQLAHSNRYPSVLRSVLFSGSFVEGWAVYAQDLMAEAGYLDRDPLYLLAHLKLHLRVIANAILDQGVHVDGMSRDEAMRLMTVQAFQQEREAAGKWVRAQVSSAQLPTYFIGWQEHHALRKEAEQRWGAGFALKRYHDTVLSFGSPPARFAGQLMFDQPIA